MGIKGEPSTPQNASQGKVWTAIVQQLDRPGSQSEYVSVVDAEREMFHHYPWSIGGGGASDLKLLLEERSNSTLATIANSMGFMLIAGEDDAYLIDRDLATRLSLPSRDFFTGDGIRDWMAEQKSQIVNLYEGDALRDPSSSVPLFRWFWAFRTLGNHSKAASMRRS